MGFQKISSHYTQNDMGLHGRVYTRLQQWLTPQDFTRFEKFPGTYYEMCSNYTFYCRCWASGWGVNAFTGGTYQSIMKEVDLPIVDYNTCQNQLRATRLGQYFQLDSTSFICAGGEAGKDACTVIQ